MNTQLTPNPSVPWAALIGFDWGDRQHAVAIHVPDQPVETLRLDHSSEGLHAWLDQIERRFGSRPVALAIEATRGACVYAMMERPWLHLFPIHPATSTHQRSAFRPSGAKDDVPDALLLLDLLQHHQARLRPLAREDQAIITLDGLARARRKTVDRRTRLGNQLRSVLKDYFPQALQWCGEDLGAPLALDFLERWPSLADLKASSLDSLRRFYHVHNVRRPGLIEKRLQQVRDARALVSDLALIAVRVREVDLLVEEMRVLTKHIRRFEDDIASAFQAHPHQAFFRDLPGAGANLAPRLLVALGSESLSQASTAELQCFLGVAPVTVRSGKSKWVHWRWNAPRFLRQTLLEWAGQTVIFSAWAKAFYEQQKAKGGARWAILRALAFKWLRILCKCWNSRTPYDEAKYLQQLKQRGSPYADRALQIAKAKAA